MNTMNTTEFSKAVAKALKAELVNEGKFPLDIVNYIVNNTDLETEYLGVLVNEIARKVKQMEYDTYIQEKYQVPTISEYFGKN